MNLVRMKKHLMAFSWGLFFPCSLQSLLPYKVHLPQPCWLIQRGCGVVGQIFCSVTTCHQVIIKPPKVNFFEINGIATTSTYCLSGYLLGICHRKQRPVLLFHSCSISVNNSYQRASQTGFWSTCLPLILNQSSLLCLESYPMTSQKVGLVISSW